MHLDIDHFFHFDFFHKDYLYLFLINDLDLLPFTFLVRIELNPG
jgi:hypothetical protein